MPVQILIPKTAAPKFVCRVPVADGSACGKRFWDGEERAWQRHVLACAKNHRAEVEAASPRVQMPVLYDPNFWDPEYEAHMRELGRRMIREGRMTTRPNER